ncbi:MFS transporter [Fonsecaea pedrosoi]|nr:MFS transporter [Fonsecaea pedrosoi]
MEAPANPRSVEKMGHVEENETVVTDVPAGKAVDPQDITHQGAEAVLLYVDNTDGDPAANGLKLAADGHTVLIPQPSDDPNDPLNWSWFKKHAFLVAASICTFSSDFGITVGVPAVVRQAEYWGVTPDKMNYTNSLCVALSGIGGLLVIPPCYFWGRAPVLFWTTLIATLLTLGLALTDDFATFYALRGIQGLFITTCNVTVLCYIKDMFFFHEHARKIGIWISLYFISPYIGPMCGSFVVAYTNGWRNPFWLSFGFNVFCCILILAFTDESWYRRDIPREEQPPRGSRLSRLLGWWQIKHHKGYFIDVLPACSRMTLVVVKPIVLPIIVYYGLTFMWAVGINICSAVLLATPPEQGGYGFNTDAVGFIYFAPSIGITLGELAGHWCNDWLAARYTHKHRGIFKPEGRLPMNFVAGLFMIPGLVLVGQTLQYRLHWTGIAFGWGIYIFGAMLASVAITAYALDCYPNGSGEVSAWLNLFRTGCGFAVPYFQLPWGAKVGYGAAFGTQAAVIILACLILLPLVFFGERLRIKGGPLRFPGSS